MNSLFELMNDLAKFVVKYDQETDFMDTWNKWIQTRTSIPEKEIPLLIATLREIVCMDKKILKEIIRADEELLRGGTIHGLPKERELQPAETE